MRANVWSPPKGRTNREATLPPGSGSQPLFKNRSRHEFDCLKTRLRVPVLGMPSGTFGLHKVSPRSENNSPTIFISKNFF